MKKTLMNLLILSISIVSAATHASSGAGNGGDGLVCKDSVVLLDVYEANNTYSLNLDLSDPNVSVPTLRSMVSVAINRLATKDIHLSNLLKKYAMEMVEDFELFERDPNARGKAVKLVRALLTEIDDSQHRSQYEDCYLKQLVSQMKPRFAYDSRYMFSKTLWERMDILNQSMTILHEAWYRIMLDNGAKNSIAARFMNAYSASTEFEADSFKTYIDQLVRTELKEYVVINNSSLLLQDTIKIFLPNLNNTSKETSSVCVPDRVVRVNVKKVLPITSLRLGLYKIKFKQVCFKNSRLSSLVTSSKFAARRANFVFEYYLIRNNGSTSNRPAIIFHDNGRVKEFTGFKFESIYKMFYEETATTRFGPFLDHSSKIKNPDNVVFDKNEELVSY